MKQEIDVKVLNTKALSPALLECLKLLAKGLLRKQIASLECVSTSAINRRCEKLERELGAKNTHHAVSLAIAKGIISVSVKSLYLVLCLIFSQQSGDFVRPKTRMNAGARITRTFSQKASA